jgi:hypothetical protein
MITSCIYPMCDACAVNLVSERLYQLEPFRFQLLCVVPLLHMLLYCFKFFCLGVKYRYFATPPKRVRHIKGETSYHVLQHPEEQRRLFIEYVLSCASLTDVDAMPVFCVCMYLCLYVLKYAVCFPAPTIVLFLNIFFSELSLPPSLSPSARYYVDVEVLSRVDLFLGSSSNMYPVVVGRRIATDRSGGIPIPADIAAAAAAAAAAGTFLSAAVASTTYYVF